MEKKMNLEKEIINERFVFYQGKDYPRVNLDSLVLAAFPGIKPGMKVMDIGTGTGIIPVLLCARQPSLEVTAVEIQKDLAELAEYNMKSNSLNSVRVINTDIRNTGTEFHNRYSLVVSNPPFFPEGSGRKSPSQSRLIAGQEVFLTLEELVVKAWKMVAPGGKFTCVYPADRTDRVAAYLHNTGFTGFRLRFIHSRADQRARAVLWEAGKDAGRKCFIEKPLIVHNSDGSYTEEVEKLMSGGVLD